MEPPAFAEVVVATGRAGTLIYSVPPQWAAQLRRGQLVQVPFGKGQRPGLVVAVHPTGVDPNPRATPAPALAQILSPEPVVGEREIELAQWLSDRYLAPLGRCLWLFVPRGSLARRDWFIQLKEEAATGETLFEHQLLEALRQSGPLWGRQLHSRMKGMPWRQAMHGLAARGAVDAALRARPKRKRRTAEWLALGEVAADAPPLGRPAKSADLLDVIRAAGEEGLPLAGALAAAQTSRSTLRRLEKESLVRVAAASEASAPDAKGKGERRVQLAVAPEVAVARAGEWRRDGGQRAILQWLREAGGPLPRGELRARGAAAADLRQLWETGRIVRAPAPPPLGREGASLSHYPPIAPRLTPDQDRAWQALKAAIAAGGFSAFLLHGVTGSGKTELYLRAIERVLALGRSALLLVPEIALTAQTLARVEARFPGQVAAVHSAVPEGERQEIVQRARKGELRIVVGARSALFTPLQRLGLVILDEEHDHSYQQTPPFPPPFYHARTLAEEMMRRGGGVLLLGSATPALESYHRAQTGELLPLCLPQRILGHRTQITALAKRSGRAHRYAQLDAAREETLSIRLPQVQVVDMRRELAAGNRSLFSRALRLMLGDVLARKEQAMLYLNRRGLHTYIFCRDCGGVLSCLRCDASLTQHEDGQLRCHYCGATRMTPLRCPRCRSDRIRFYGAGTQQLQRALQREFPRVRSLRWDADTARRPAEHERILQRFLAGEAQVLIGTQMIAKGLDLPLVTLVGVVNADRGLALPDFRAAERVFQLLTQVAGRAGRGLLGGRVLLQTYRPEHPVIQAAAQHDYAQFAEQELRVRRELGDPPFGRLARLVCRHRQELRAQAEAEQATRWLHERIRSLRLKGLQVVGPLPCYHTRLQDHFRWQVLLRGEGPAAPLELVFQAQPSRRGWTVELDPLSTL